MLNNSRDVRTGSPTLDFFLLWLRRPARLGTFTPSGPALAGAVAGEIDVSAPGRVVELGGGTGTVTRAILDAGVAPRDLVVIERERVLCQGIATRFPEVRVVEGDAREIERILDDGDDRPVKAIVSGLPLLSLDRPDVHRILGAAFRVLEPGGVLLQYTYSPGSPIARETRRRLGILGERSHWVLRNIPPATVWRYWRSITPGVLSPVPHAA